MADRLKKGDVTVFQAASDKGIKIDLLRRDFSGATLKNIVIKDTGDKDGSMISKCSFVNASIFASMFENVNFVKCDFSEADMFEVSFKNCQFNECSFNSTRFQGVDFAKDCIINSCTFAGVDLTSNNGVTGIDVQNFKIILEKDIPAVPALIELGFTETSEGDYELFSDENMVCCVAFDPELMNGQYREIIIANYQTLYTYDLPKDLSDLTVQELSVLLTIGLKAAKKMAESEDQRNAIDTLIEKITK